MSTPNVSHLRLQHAFIPSFIFTGLDFQMDVQHSHIHTLVSIVSQHFPFLGPQSMDHWPKLFPAE